MNLLTFLTFKILDFFINILKEFQICIIYLYYYDLVILQGLKHQAGF